MPARPPSKQAAPAVILDNLCLGYNGYTSPTLANEKMWASALNCFGGAFGFIQRCRFANVYTQSPTTGLPYKSLKYFAIPGTGAYLLGDQNGKLYSYDTSSSYTQTQRLNPYVDPSGAGSSQLNGPFSRETLQSIVYEMNGQVKMAGRNANAATIEGWGLDAPDSTPQVTISAGSSQNITGITRSQGTVTATLAGALSIPFGVALPIVNVNGVTDPSFNGAFVVATGNGTNTFTWLQQGQNTSSSGGTANTNITKAVGRSYAWAWENANKSHLGPPSPATQYIQYVNQLGTITLAEPGTITVGVGSASVVGTNTFFTSAWIGRNLWSIANGAIAVQTRIVAVADATHMTLASVVPTGVTGQQFQIYDPQATHIRLYETADGGATYFRVYRNVWTPSVVNFSTNGLTFVDTVNSEPPNFPFTTETAQTNNLPPPIGQFVNEYQGNLLVYGVSGAAQSFFYSNQTATTIGLLQESFAPLNQVTLPIQNAQINGMLEFPGSLIIWSDKQDMFRLTGLLTDNTVTGVAQNTAAAQQGAQIARLPYNLGCATPFAAEITPLGGIWLTPNAEVWLFTDRYAPRNIGRPIQDILNSATPANLSLARMKFYHTNNRNWLALAYPANGASFNNTLLVLDIDLLSSNGSPSYFTFDMATNSPAWWVFEPGTSISGTWTPRCDSMEVVYENNGVVRLLVGQIDLIQDVDFQAGSGTEIQVPNGSVTTHAWGNDSAYTIKRPSFMRFTTNRDPSVLTSDGWAFAALGIDDDVYTFANPLVLNLIPGTNDTATLGGNPDFAVSGLAFRYSQELYRIGGVNFIAGRRIRFQVNFPVGTGTQYQFRSVQLGFGAEPPN